MLAGKKTILRAPTKADAEFLVGLRNDIETQMLTMAMPRANTPARVMNWVSGMLDDPGSAGTQSGAVAPLRQLDPTRFVGHGPCN